MSRIIIGKLAIKYNDDTVCQGNSYFEFDTSDIVPTDSDCILAFLTQALLGPSVFIGQINNTTSVISATNLQWQQDYIDPDAPKKPSNSTRIQPKIAHILNDAGSPLIAMLDIDDTGMDIASGEIMLPYAFKKVRLEISDITAADYTVMLTDLTIDEAVDFSQTESLYQLIKPFLSNSVPTLDDNGYQIASDDGKKITLFGKAVVYKTIQM